MITQFPLFFFRCSRISQWVWNGDGWYNSVGSHCFCNWNQVAHLYNWNTCFFNLFYHRCAATCAGSSRRHHNDAIHVVFLKIWNNFLCHSLCLCLSSTCSNCGIKIWMQTAVYTFFFQSTQCIDWCDDVWICVCCCRVKSSMNSFIDSAFQIITALNIISAPTSSGCRLDAVRIINRNDSSGVEQRNSCFAQVLDSRSNRYTVHLWNWKFCLEWLIVKLFHQHINHTFRCRNTILSPYLTADASCKITFLICTANFFAVQKLICNFRAGG